MSSSTRSRVRITTAALSTLALAALHAGALLHEPAARAGARSGGAITGAITSPFTLRLHGSTPTLAWSPDSKRVAVASGYEYYGFSGQVRRHSQTLGIYVVDPKRRKGRRISTDQGYHPLWLDKHTVAWGHSPYERGTPGLYVARLGGRTAKVRRVGTFKGVYHTRLARRRGHVLLYSGWPEYNRWVEVNVRNGRMSPSPAAGGSRDSWTAPPKAYVSQCRQRVGKIRTGVTPTGRFLLETATQNVAVPGIPFRFYNYNGTGTRRSCSAGGRCGPVMPCLSPDGKWLAYVTGSAHPGEFVFHVMAVPH